MNNLELLKHLERPAGKVRMILDTDAYNEIDDQYAIAYAAKSKDKLDVLAIYAAPFQNKKAETAKIGMEKSYDEILNILTLMGEDDLKKNVFKGSESFMQKKGTPIMSDAAKDLVKKAMGMEDGEKLYVVAIGAITNVASAILLEPMIVDKIVIVWLGGNAWFWNHNMEFNSQQDVYSTKIVFDSGVPLIQLPCMGVTSHLTTTEPELRHYLKGKNKLCDYLYEITCNHALFEEKGKVWSKEIWDIVTIAWLVGDETWMRDAFIHSPIVTHEHTYSVNNTRHFINQIQEIRRDKIFEDLFHKLASTDTM